MAVIVIAMLINEIITYIYGKKYSNKLVELVMKGKFDEFDNLVDKGFVRYCVRPFNLDYIKLNSYLIRNDENRITAAFDNFKNKSLTQAQKVEVFTKAFNFYVFNEDKEQCDYYKEQINALKGYDSLKDETNRMYDILIEKKTDMLDELLEEMNQVEEKERGAYEYLIAEIYTNLGKKKEAKKYSELASKHLVGITKPR